MNKRTLLFALCLFAGLFMVQMAFDKPAPKQPAAAVKREVIETKAVETVRAAPEQRYVLENGVQQLVISSRGGALVEVNLPFSDQTHPQSAVKRVEIDRKLKSQGHPLLRQTHQAAGYGLNLVSEYPEMAEMEYRVTHQDTHKIVLEAQQDQRHIVKTYTLSDLPYVVDLEVKVEGDARGLWLTSGMLEMEPQSPTQGKTQLFYRQLRPKGASVEEIALPDAQRTSTITGVSPQWIGSSNGYFEMLIQPLDPIGPESRVPGYRVVSVSGKEMVSRHQEGAKEEKLNSYQVQLPLSGAGTSHFRVYAGPMDRTTLQSIDASIEDSPHFTDSLRAEGWLSAVSGPIARFLWWFLDLFHMVTHSWAAAIILVTVVLRLALYPLNSWTFRSMRKMQALGPEIKAMQERYKKEPKKAQGELMKLYRKNGVNPMGGCLPLVIQMPFLMGMFELLKSAFPLRGAGFVPGWITDLTAPDVLFSWSTPIFVIGNELHLLPLIVGAAMFLQQRLFTKLPKDKALWTDQQRQQRTMGTIMTAFFIFMFYSFPSGLNLYWLSSMLLGMLQQWWVFRKMKMQPVETVVEAKVTPSKKKKLVSA
jgi:YidC/Oxa1 family membrane protein insertase